MDGRLSENYLIQPAAGGPCLDKSDRFNLTQLHRLEKKVPEKEIDEAELVDIDAIEDELPWTDIAQGEYSEIGFVNTAAQLSKAHENRHLLCDFAKGLGATEMPQTTRQLPQRRMTFCALCNVHPQGFRGHHELRRHMDCHHTNRKVWICKDNSASGGSLPAVPLSKCKACRNNKTYGASYNAAAHLRRAHFYPYQDKRGGRGQVSPGRAGMGGGEEPPMEELENWMYEQMQVNKPQLSQIDADMMLDDTGLDDTGLDDTGLDDTGLDDTGLDDTAPSYNLPFNVFQEPAQSYDWNTASYSTDLVAESYQFMNGTGPVVDLAPHHPTQMFNTSYPQ
jgi:hypothetical protein